MNIYALSISVKGLEIRYDLLQRFLRQKEYNTLISIFQSIEV